MSVWPGSSALYINFLRGLSLDSWSVFRGVDDALLENDNDECAEGLFCTCSGWDRVLWDVDGEGVGRAGASGGFLRGCAVVEAGMGRMGTGDCDPSGTLVRGCMAG